MNNSVQTFRTDIRCGELYWVDWSPGRGSEQMGRRPALIISLDEMNANPRYPLVITVALSTKGNARFATNVEILPDTSNGLKETTFAKTEQIQTTYKERLLGKIGKITEIDMKKVEVALSLLFTRHLTTSQATGNEANISKETDKLIDSL